MKEIERLAKEWCETPVKISFTYNDITTDCGTGTYESTMTCRAAYMAGFRKARRIMLAHIDSICDEKTPANFIKGLSYLVALGESEVE